MPFFEKNYSAMGIFCRFHQKIKQNTRKRCNHGSKNSVYTGGSPDTGLHLPAAGVFARPGRHLSTRQPGRDRPYHSDQAQALGLLFRKRRRCLRGKNGRSRQILPTAERFDGRRRLRGKNAGCSGDFLLRQQFHLHLGQPQRRFYPAMPHDFGRSSGRALHRPSGGGRRHSQPCRSSVLSQHRGRCLVPAGCFQPGGRWTVL